MPERYWTNRSTLTFLEQALLMEAQRILPMPADFRAVETKPVGAATLNQDFDHLWHRM